MAYCILPHLSTTIMLGAELLYKLWSLLLQTSASTCYFLLTQTEESHWNSLVSCPLVVIMCSCLGCGDVWFGEWDGVLWGCMLPPFPGRKTPCGHQVPPGCCCQCPDLWTMLILFKLCRRFSVSSSQWAVMSKSTCIYVRMHTYTHMHTEDAAEPVEWLSPDWT